MIRYFRNTVTDVVFGYEPEQEDLIEAAEADPDFEEVTGEWPPEPDPAPPVVPQPTLYAVALLTISPGEIGGIGVNSRFSAAVYADVGLYYLFFAETQPDTSYLAKGYDDVARVSVSEKYTDYIVVEAIDANEEPVDPAEVSIEIIRVS